MKCKSTGKDVLFHLVLLISLKEQMHRSEKKKRDPRHHKGTNPLEQLDVNMVDQFVLDYIDCVNLGVMRRLPNFLTNTIPFKISSAAKQNVNSQLPMIRKYIPREFNRLPRDLSHFRQVQGN